MGRKHVQFFNVGVGNRQGGILSTDLYKLYINPPLDRLQDVGIGLKEETSTLTTQDVQTTSHYSVLSSVMHRSWSTWLLTLRTSNDMNYNQRKV
jgi:hypothetical protein